MRRRSFERRFKSVVEEKRQWRRNRSTSRRRLSLPDSRPRSRPEVDGVVVRGRKITPEEDIAEKTDGHLSRPNDTSQPDGNISLTTRCFPKPESGAEDREADDLSFDPPQARQPLSIDTGVTRRITFSSPALRTRERQHGRILSMQGVGARQNLENHPLRSPRPMYLDELPSTGEGNSESLPLPRQGTLSGGFVGRNSQFSNLSLAEREKIGGVEYRAVTYLAVIVPLYFLLWQLLGCIGLGAYVASKRASTTEINAENPWYEYPRSACPLYFNIRQLTPLQGGLALSMEFRLLITAG